MTMQPSTFTKSAELTVARIRLTHHLLGYLNTDCAIDERCTSRTLESALAYPLIRSAPRHHAAADRLREIIERSVTDPATDWISAAVAKGVLGQSTQLDRRCFQERLASFAHHSSARKQVTFRGLLALAHDGSGDAVLFDRDLDPHSYETGRLNLSAGMLLRCMKIIHACKIDRRDLITRTDIYKILETQRRHGIWENITLTHILALIALNELGGHRSVIDAGIERLIQARNPDGGIPFVTKADIFCTAICGLALAGAPYRDPVIGQLADYLASRQQPDGGWAYGTGATQTDIDDTAYALEALKAIDPTGHQDAIARGEQYLLAVRNDDGGFPTYPRGTSSEPAMTAGALNALAGQQPSLIRNSLDYLLDSQLPNGTFETSWSLSQANAIFRAVSALSTYNTPDDPLGQRIQQSFDRSHHRLSATQNTDGGWGQQPGHPSDPISTSYALIATITTAKSDPHIIENGTSYLLRQQQPHGGFTSIPDTAGPRPIPHDLPVLAGAFVLRAWNCVGSWHKQIGEQWTPPRWKDALTSRNYCAAQAILIWHGTPKTRRAVRPLEDMRRARTASAQASRRPEPRRPHSGALVFGTRPAMTAPTRCQSPRSPGDGPPTAGCKCPWNKPQTRCRRPVLELRST